MNYKGKLIGERNVRIERDWSFDWPIVVAEFVNGRDLDERIAKNWKEGVIVESLIRLEEKHDIVAISPYFDLQRHICHRCHIAQDSIPPQAALEQNARL